MARQKAGTIAEIHAGTGREGAAPRPATTTALGKTTGKSLKGHPLGRSLDKEIAQTQDLLEVRSDVTRPTSALAPLPSTPRPVASP